MKSILYIFLLVTLGCTPPVVSPGMTFLVTLDRYRDEMARLENRPDRWFDRQELAEWLKIRYAVSFGRSAEFARMADMDLRRREFTITLRQTSLKPERVREMKEELATMNRAMEDLKETVSAQMARAEMGIVREDSRRIEAVAAIGLLTRAINNFSSPNSASASPATPTMVGQFTVTDYGNFVTVTTPGGQVHRCTPVIFEEGAAIKCEVPPGKS